MKFIRPLLDLVSGNGTPDYVVSSPANNIGKILFFSSVGLFFLLVIIAICKSIKNSKSQKSSNDNKQEVEKESTKDQPQQPTEKQNKED